MLDHLAAVRQFCVKKGLLQEGGFRLKPPECLILLVPGTGLEPVRKFPFDGF